MKDYTIQLFLNTVDILRDLYNRGDYPSLLADDAVVDGSTIKVGFLEITITENDDNSIDLQYKNVMSDLIVNRTMPWFEYVGNTRKIIKELLSEALEKEEANRNEMKDNIINIIMSGLNITAGDVINDNINETTVLSFRYKESTVDVYLHDSGVMGFHSENFMVTVPFAKLSPSTLVEEILKPYIKFYNVFY